MINVKRIAIKEIINGLHNEDIHVLLPYPQEELIELIFDQKKDENGSIYYEFNSIIYSIISKIDFSNVPFDNVKLAGYSLSGCHGIKFNPQTIYQKDLTNTSLSETTEVIGNNEQNQKDLFEGVKIIQTHFNGCQNVIINPQTIYNKNFTYTTLKGVNFNGFSFDGASLWQTSFEGSVGAKINPNTVKDIIYASSLKGVTLADLIPGNYSALYTADNYDDLIDTKNKYKQLFMSSIQTQIPQIPQTPEAVEIPASEETTTRGFLGLSKKKRDKSMI